MAIGAQDRWTGGITLVLKYPGFQIETYRRAFTVGNPLGQPLLLDPLFVSIPERARLGKHIPERPGMAQTSKGRRDAAEAQTSDDGPRGISRDRIDRPRPGEQLIDQKLVERWMAIEIAGPVGWA